MAKTKHIIYLGSHDSYRLMEKLLQTISLLFNFSDRLCSDLCILTPCFSEGTYFSDWFPTKRHGETFL